MVRGVRRRTSGRAVFFVVCKVFEERLVRAGALAHEGKLECGETYELMH
jgi:hypothetical protein